MKRAAIQNSFVAIAGSTLPPGYGPYSDGPSHPAGPCVQGDPDYVRTSFTLGTTNGPPNYWCGSGVTDTMNGQIDDAYGLMVVANLLGAAAWVLVTMVAQGSTALVGRKYAYEGVVGTMLASALFALCSVGVFDSSGIKNSFCSTLDPDSGDGVQLYCGYYDGFFAVRFGSQVGAGASHWE